MLRIRDLKVEGLTSGCITDKRPRIHFALESDRSNEALKVATIRCEDWVIETDDTVSTVYGGPLKAHTTYTVSVSAVGNSGDTDTQSVTFRTGRLDRPWSGQWITDHSLIIPDKLSPTPMMFRKNFVIRKPLQKAWIEMTAWGVYTASLNGIQLGNDYFMPGFTSYDHTLQYQTLDVTQQLHSDNTLLVTVAGGWAVGAFNYVRKNKISADRQALLAEIHVIYEDGSTETIVTDESWEVSCEGPYRFAEWYDGETYDATIDPQNILWKKAELTKPRQRPQLLAHYGAPVRRQATLDPVSCVQAPSGEWIFDFGQNFAGVIAVTATAHAGQRITFRHAEVLFENELFVKSLRTAKATATLIAKEGQQFYSPQLTYMGFRYVGVSGIDPQNIQLQAYVLHSDIEETGFFECSNPLLNRLQSNICWGGKSNFVDIPTDCPQRDERQGWTGDLAVFARTATYNFDMSRFLDKWLMDMRAEQSRGGGYPMVIPKGGDHWPAMANSCWGDASILVPWAEYLARGNVNLLREHYPSMKRFLKAAKWWSGLFSIRKDQRHIWRFPFHFGDWCAPDETVKQWLAKGKWVGTAYFANSCQIMSQIAEILGETDDVVYYKSLRKNLIHAYRNVFTDGKGTLKQPFQTAYVLPLAFGMTQGEETKAMVENLATLIHQADNHLTTGFTGTPYLLFALSDHGYLDLAYSVLLQETCPSWLYEVLAGGTTIWERWDALRPDGTVNIADLSSPSDESSQGGMVSFNHYANGAVGDWLYRRVLGLEASSGGYKTFTIEPRLGGNLTMARGHVKTPYGQLAVAWTIEQSMFTLTLNVPVSTQGRVILPDGQTFDVGSGSSTFTCPITADLKEPTHE